jgi:predicted permease
MNDLRLAFRMLVKSPGFTVVAVITLALGIGANTAIFSVVKAVVLEPFPYPAANRLVHVWETQVGHRWHSPLSAPEFFDLRESNQSFEELGVYCPYAFNLGITEPVRLSGVLCSAGVLRALGVQPALGRWFTEQEELDGSRPVVLSHDAWQKHFDAAGDIVGRFIKVNGVSHRVVGVMPPQFEFLCPWFQGQTYALWTPFPEQGGPGQLARDERLRDSHWMLTVGRLKPGVSHWAAEADLRRIAAQLAETHPKTNNRSTLWVDPFLVATLGSTIGRLLLLMATVGFVLLVACANVASLVLARSAGRLTEVAVRVALGASRWRIVRQMLSESFVLAAVGGVVGIWLAQVSLGAVRSFLPAELPRAGTIQLDGGVLAFTILLTLATALLFGLAPALVAARTQVNEVLKEGAGGQGTLRTRARWLRVLAAAQVAMALLVTNEAVLLFKSLRNVLTSPHAFDTRQVLTASLHLSEGEYRESQQRVRFWEQLIERAEALPQVECAAVANQVPLRGGGYRGFRLDGEATSAGAGVRMAAGTFVSPDYFRAMGITVLAGRTFQPGDERLPVQRVVVNRTLAEKCWPGQQALGQRLHDHSGRSEWSAEVVGIVESTRQQRPELPPESEIYWPYAVNPWHGSYLIVRSTGNPKLLVPAIRKTVAELDPSLPLTEVQTMGEVLMRAAQGRRFLTTLISLFGGLILSLAMTGIYGVVSYQVAQRTREVGIRMALGAGRDQIFRLVFGQTLRLLGVGLGIGVAFAIGVAFITRSLLYLTSALDLLYLGLGACLVFVATLAATLVPAWRAARVNPIQALRNE